MQMSKDRQTDGFCFLQVMIYSFDTGFILALTLLGTIDHHLSMGLMLLSGCIYS